ncbi:hypothetical protein C8J43_104316 [Sphingomonas sp. PP-CE-1G-424]|nr:hypothetical protein C8J43_104316 [Sphingomonas sp. PP-CE-1G-424]
MRAWGTAFVKQIHTPGAMVWGKLYMVTYQATSLYYCDRSAVTARVWRIACSFEMYVPVS